MKKTSFYRGLYLLGLLLLYCQLSFGKGLEVSEKKEINKTFNWTQTDNVEVSNKYGEITVTHWTKPEVAFRIVIEVKARNKEQAKETLDRIGIQFSDTPGSISAQTEIEPEKKSWGINFGKNVQFDIRYYISLPAEARCDLEQKYGNIIMLEKHTGDCSIQAKYGNIELGDFAGALSLSSKYGNVKVENYTQADLDLGYSGSVSLGSGNQLNIESKYSNMKLKGAKQLNIDMKYSQLDAGTVGDFELDSKYSNVTLEELQGNLNVSELGYGKFSAQKVSPDFREIDIDARYSTVELNIPTSASFNVNAEGFRYASCKIRGFKNMSNFEQDEDRTTCTVNGGKTGKISFDGNGYSNLFIEGF